MYIALSDHAPLAKRFQDLKSLEKEAINFSCLDKDISYMPIEIQINSGDMLYLLCESIDFFEKDLDVEESRKRRELSITKNWIE